MQTMSREELEILAGLIAGKLERDSRCSLTPSEQQAVKDLLNTKKRAVKLFLYICGALALWIIKDTYIFLTGHLTFK